MLDDALPSPHGDEPEPARSRKTLTKRLADTVCLPTSRIDPHERDMTADLLVEILHDSEARVRGQVARRLADLADAPQVLIRLLACDDISIARPLLEDSQAITDSELCAVARVASFEHRIAIARRQPLSDVVVEAVAAKREDDVIAVLLANKDATIPSIALEQIVADSRRDSSRCAALAARPEMTPSLAFAMFWWSDTETRATILRRFSVPRAIVREAANDVFAIAANEGGPDAPTRKVLQFVDRRQRKRAAIERSPYESLEDAVEAARHEGISQTLVEEISHLAGVKPATGAQIITDAGGEPLAVLCKGTGLKRAFLEALLIAIERRTTPDGADHPAFEQAMLTYDLMATEKAQTVLRYWNWSLTSACAPALLADADFDEPSQSDPNASPAAFAARLVFGRAAQ